MAEIDPFALKNLLWPDVKFYDRQVEIIDSVWANDETVVPAGNMLGKDFVAGFISLAFFLSAALEGRTCRVVTTSVKDDHLRVLWGEIGRFIRECKVNLAHRHGLILNHHDIRLAREYPGYYSYLRGMVSEKGEGMTGHHAEKTLLVIDEASGVDEQVYDQGRTWADKILIIGNPNPCQNFFIKAVEGGPIAAESNGHLYRSVIRVRAEDSPNVKLGLEQEARGQEPTDHVVVPGLLTYSRYKQRRATWDAVRQCIGLDGAFYKGREVLLFPPEWLNLAERRAIELRGAIRRGWRTMGHDSGEGVADSAWYIVDDFGILYGESRKTPDTSFIPNNTIALMNRFNVKAEDVWFDRGGGGLEHADQLRQRGYGVNTVAFGSQATPPPVWGRKPFDEQVEIAEVRYAYKNKRAEMYGLLHLRLDPSANEHVFALPAEYDKLRRQLAPIPKWFDGEGRLYLPSKTRRPDLQNSNAKTMIDLVGCSPDQADALVLAVYGLSQPAQVKIGVLF